MLIGSLELDGKPAQASLAALNGSFESALKGFSKFGKQALVGVAAFAGFTAVMAGFRETLDLGGKLNDLSLQTGEAVGDLVILRQAFENAGLGADATGDFLLKLQDSIAGVNEDGKSTAGALKALGLGAASLRGMGGLEQVAALQKGFEGIADQAQRVAVARDLLGKSGGKSLALLGDGEALAQARQQAGPLADVMQRNVATFDKLGDVLNGLKLNSQEFFAGALEAIAPKATNIAQALGSIDFVGFGRGAGQFINVLLDLANVLMSLAPVIQQVGDLMGSLSGATIKGAGIGAVLGKFLPGGSLIGGLIGGGLGSLFGGDSAAAPKSTGFAQGFKGFAEAAKSSTIGPVGALQRLGGGGGFSSGGDPLLSETRRQTKVMEAVRTDLVKFLSVPARAFGAMPAPSV